jgi:hypothetical protein
MKISKDKLKKIVKEEIDLFLERKANQSIQEIALCHNKKGHFTDCEKGSVYSLSQKGAKAAGVDDKFVGRGKVSRKEKKDDGSYWIQAPYGMNSSNKKVPGRIKMPSGEDVNPEYSVSNYDEKYDEAVDKTKWNPNWKSAKDRKKRREIQKPSNSSWFPGKEEFSALIDGRGLGIFEDASLSIDDVLEIVNEAFPVEDVTEASNGMIGRCRKMGLITVSEAQRRILRALNAFALAQDGKLNSGQSGRD